MKMKKLILALVVSSIVTVLHAASAQWNITKVQSPVDGQIASSMVAYLVDASDVSLADMNSALSTVGLDKLTENNVATKNLTVSSSTGVGTMFNVTVNNDAWVAGTGDYTFYTVVIADVGDQKYYLLSQTITTSVNATTQAFDPKLTFGDQSTNKGWGTVAIPEPTSGLLLLVGGALLALRRKQK